MKVIEVLTNLRARYEGGRVYQMQHDELYEQLGHNPKHHLPAIGITARMIGNVLVWVVPKTDKPQDAARTWCECPHCKRHLTAGKLQQHLKVHKEKTNAC